MIDITLVTEDRYENPTEPDWYDLQILQEDGLVRNALEAHGLRVHRVSWSNPHFDWSSTKVAVLRTTWDYFYKIDAFMAWLEHAEQHTNLINSPRTLRWNTDKRYLLDLSAKGVAIPPTRLVEKGQQWDLKDSFKEWNCTAIIVKPCIGGGARHTYRIEQSEAQPMQAEMDALFLQEHFLIQPFFERILSDGEVSVLLFGGKISHAVRKSAKQGDFRVQDDFGGTVAPHQATEAECQLALDAVKACPEQPAYARADIMFDASGAPVISELELVEPELFFRFHPAAAIDLANIVAAHFRQIT